MVVALSGGGAQVRSLSESVVAVSANVTRPLPRARALNLGAWTAAPPPYPPPLAGEGREGAAALTRPAPRHPARHAPESTVDLLARGSSPGTAFPGFPSGTVVWACRIQLRGPLRHLKPPPYPPPPAGEGREGASAS